MKISFDPYSLSEISNLWIGSEVPLGDISMIEIDSPLLEKLGSDSPEVLAELKQLLFKVIVHTSNSVHEVETVKRELDKKSEEERQERERIRRAYR